MTKYHISPTTGNPNKCYATKQCPFGGDADHYGSKEEARSAFEAQMASESFGTVKKVKEAPVHEGASTYHFSAERLDEAISAIEKANRRLEKFGIEDRFEYDAEVYNRTVESPWTGGPAFAEERVAFTLKNPSISYGGHRFLAVVEAEEEGLITRTGAGVELNGWRPTSMECEHCGHNRGRSKTYLVEAEDGTRKQIGSTCVEGYLGVKPEGLWALSLDPVEKIHSDDSAPAINPRRLSRPVDFTLALALAVSDEGRDFVSKSQAYNYGTTSTAEALEDVMWGASNLPAEKRREFMDKADEYMATGKVDEVLTTIRSVEGDTDYATNLRTVAAGEWVKPQNTAVLISGLTAYRRQLRAQEEAAKPQPVAGFAGEVGAKMKGTKATVTAVRHIDDYDRWGNPMTRSQVVYRDEAGHELVWWASSRVNTEEGAEVVFSGGTVKNHGSFRGVDQTVLTRVKMDAAS